MHARLAVDEDVDRGSDVVFVVAGRCGLGALAVAGIRGVWAIDADEATTLREHVLMRMFKQHERSVDVAVRAYFSDSLPGGREITLGIEDDYAVSMELSWAIPAGIESKIVGFCSSIRQHALVDHV